MGRRHHAYAANGGFTLIELLLVVIIIGLLASIGIANFISMSENAKFASCVVNQRHVHEAALLWGNDNDVTGNVSINVTVLTAAGLLQQEVGECPSSGNTDYDDYTIDFTNGVITQIICTIRGADHLYEPQ